MMEKKEFMGLVEKAFDERNFNPESIFLFKLFQFDFQYDDENRTCTITCPISEVMLNPSGIVHGGVYTFLTDTAMGHLNFRLKDAPYVSLELKTSYFKAASTGNITATARYTKEGYKVCFMECEVHNEEGDLLCKTSGTFYRYQK
ncbi:PaaI family thioesterase [Oceanobacillus caeni]|uniref:PaaI family thioesterase n=1 Tax=Bacillaceae TaxID=186817 RepID=UPI00069B0AA4|nr:MULTISPECIES: PaaI family thioesterase [Bacillaceae]PZD87985.1 PaaI family thioesterase [Bacilli bacterium]MCR1832823.1 PaaI family thioesterase [Oceanobacillus caeni]PZD90176.1 PaaI family thioesterase [Bacilli bacterium]PZD92070.1 PaaI family thioesterase [Bacilli bacterium]RCO06954.1 PaaI family thioesterase [Bacilli bacterium]